MNRRILAIVAVGKEYADWAIDVIERFKTTRWEIHILTDDERIFNYDAYCNIEFYKGKIFSYFDKMLFVLRCVEETKWGVLYVDVDRVHEYPINFLDAFSESNEVTIMNYWHGENKKFKGNYDTGIHFKPLVKYCEENNIDYDADTISEEIFYVPPLNEIDQIIYDVEKLRPVFEYQSLISISTNKYYPNVGNAEGLALSIALKKNGYEIKRFKND